MRNIGLLGCGNISKGIIKAINEEKIHFRVISLFDIDLEKAKQLARKIEPKPKITTDFDDFLRDVDLVVEVASQGAVRKYSEKILSLGKNLIIMSVGALVDEKFLEKIRYLAKENNARIYFPSGAILGIDGLKAARIGKMKEVILLTRKSPESLGMNNIDEEKIIFDGFVKEAVEKFPKNINVAATISLSGIGIKKTKVKIIADPKVKKNIHEIHAIGEFGEFLIKVRNVPSIENPRTSYLAVLSVIATLKKIEEDELQIGT
jgi:aspartate dehydrogenase